MSKLRFRFPGGSECHRENQSTYLVANKPDLSTYPTQPNQVETEEEPEEEPPTIEDDLDLDIPGAFPHLTPSPGNTPTRSRPPSTIGSSQSSSARRRDSSGPIFRIGLGGGSITIGGDGGAGSSNSGRRTGFGAGIGTGGLRTSHSDNVPSLAE